MPLTIKPITAVFGARVGGVDINKPLDDKTFAAVRAVFDEHLVLIFSGQPMTYEQQTESGGWEKKA